jgi:hypothetical protein
VKVEELTVFFEGLNAVGTVALSAAALTFSIVTWRKERRERADQLREDARREADQRAAEDNKRDDELLAWSNRAIDSMSRIDALCRYSADDLEPGEFNRRKADLAAEVSAILDQGRIFFPNVQAEGREDPTSKGLRPRILDELRLAYLIARDLSPSTPLRNKYRRTELWDARGRLVGYLRAAVGDSRKRDVPAGQSGRSVKLDELPGEADMANQQPYQAVHRR